MFVRVSVCVCVRVCGTRSYIGDDSSLTDEETVLVVEEVVLMMAFAITEIKRLLFIDSIMDSIKVRGHYQCPSEN